jgi:hypothetical protein
VHEALATERRARDHAATSFQWRNTMKHFVRVVTFLTAAHFCAAAVADETAGATAPEQTQAAARAAYSNKPICKRVTVTGSYVKRTVCKTQEQMDRDKAAMDQWAQEIKRSGSWNTVNADH